MNFRWRHGLIGFAVAALAGLFFWWTPSGDALVNLSYDLPFRFRGDVKTDGITILYMDLESVARLNQMRHAAWDRSVHARLLDRLKELHARAVVFDILFLPSNEDPAGDQRLVAAAKSFGNVVVAAKPAHEFLGGELMGQPLMKPFPALADVAHWGVVEAADAHKTIRKHYCRDDYGFDAPCLASITASLVNSNAPPESVTPRWLNYYGPPGTLRHHSYYEIFQTNQIPLTDISNQVVFVGGLYDIGFSGGSNSDDFRTPYTGRSGRLAAGVEIGATSYFNQTHAHWLHRLRPVAEFFLLLVGALIIGVTIGALRPMAAIAMSIFAALATAVAGIGGVWQTHFWFPWMIPVAVQIPCALAWSILVHTKRLAREKHSLEQALALASRGAIESEARPAASPLTAYPQVSNLPHSTKAPVAMGARMVIPDHELLRCIGRGAYGEVWLARDVIGTFHAVKILHRSTFVDAVPFEREFNGIRKFTPISRSHPGFVHILHVGRNDAEGWMFYVMELGDDVSTGQVIDPDTYAPLTLAVLLEKRGRVPLVECLELCVQLADALNYLHLQQLIHRDIKPSNIIFVKGLPKFADIGLVTNIGRDATYLGTPVRIAPEGPGLPSADVYSLGKIIYETGLGLGLDRFPELPTDLIAGGNDAALFQLNRIILKACASEARLRHASAAALREDLSALLKSLRKKTND